MDVETTNGWRTNDVVTAEEIQALINRQHPIQQIDPNYSGEVAKRWSFVDGGGEIGLIASVTRAFCTECSRIRMSTDGKLYTCLFATKGTDLREPLRNKADDADLRRLMAGTWAKRSDRYSEIGHAATELPGKKIEMSYIGG